MENFMCKYVFTAKNKILIVSKIILILLICLNIPFFFTNYRFLFVTEGKPSHTGKKKCLFQASINVALAADNCDN